ncbi:unnamed protein product [Medioppia subpectinata]|uniref:C2H2-type domain-containing protein n=1 Tax=Medioppia subpectinata TaxID=1979941 RepID=A0A7R9Q5Q3_9ACAR|nr:unnamed protein product [Medioppia subpectinata]CAG2113063.1 unnamed protein product [Medioppia subpectinata]
MSVTPIHNISITTQMIAKNLIILTHRAYNPLPARVVQITLDSKSLIRHIRVIHEQKSCHECHRCGRQFTWKFSYLRHINTICQLNNKSKHS